MRSQRNKLISQVAVKTLGVTANGQRTSGFFPSAERRASEARQQPLSVDVRLRQAKADVMYLRFGVGGVETHGSCVLVPSFDKGTCL